MALLSDLLASIKSRLTIDEDIKNFESKVIAQHVLGLEFSEMLKDREVELLQTQLGQFESIISQRNSSMPLAYVINSVTFRELELFVDSRVLIPRPETELLVEMALEWMQGLSDPVVLDMGTGSGAIALSVGLENKRATVIAVDVSKDALDVARINCAALGQNLDARVSFKLSDMFEALDKNLKCDVIISNPPYGSKNENVHQAVLDHEPREAVFSDNDGIYHIQRIIENAGKFLKPNGCVFIEMGETQAQRVIELAKKNSLDAEIHKDFAERDRFARLISIY